MKLTIVAYGIAREILQNRTMAVELPPGACIADLKHTLFKRYPGLQALANISFAVDEEYEEDSFLLSDHQSVVIIPPVSGG